MNLSSTTLKRIGLALFSAGVLLAVGLTALMVWADIEALWYGFPRLGKDPLRGLACPQLMNRAESTQFSLTLHNTTDRTLRPQVQVFVSEPGLDRWRTVTTPVEIAAGARTTAAWDVSPDDIVLGQFVLVKAYTFASYPLPDQEGACGIFVVSIPRIGGKALFWLWLVGSLLLLGAGFWLHDYRQHSAEPSPGNRLVRGVLAGLAVLGLAAGGAGWWVVGIIVLIVIILTIPAALFVGQSSSI